MRWAVIAKSGCSNSVGGFIANRPCMAISRGSKVVVDGMVVTGVYHDEIDTELTAIATETVGWAMPIFGSLRNTPASGYRYRIYSGAISSHARTQLIQITNTPNQYHQGDHGRRSPSDISSAYRCTTNNVRAAWMFRDDDRRDMVVIEVIWPRR